MRSQASQSMKTMNRTVTVLALLASLVVPAAVFAGKKKAEKKDAAPTIIDPLKYYDLSKIVWPNPPAITRIRFISQFTGEQMPSAEAQAAAAKKGKWMDRLAGVSAESQPKFKQRFQLVQPFGVAVDSKGLVYVADEKVGAIFIFNTETRGVQLIKNGVDGNFSLITGIAIDDTDRLFVADGNLHQVSIFNPKHELEAKVREGLDQPVGVAVDNENRLLYVADSGMDQVVTYDLDSFKLIRKLGTAGKNHTSTEPGQFSRPVGVAVDHDGNLYVTDTFNNRVEVFDADGQFIRAWGKAGDGPGTFARAKGIAVDCDNHIWVVDSMQNRVHVFTPEGQLLIWFGGRGLRPGEMTVPVGITVDKFNRVFTTEQLPGRLQIFRYVTQEEALAEKKRRDELDGKKDANNAESAKADAKKDAAQAIKPEPQKNPAP